MYQYPYSQQSWLKTPEFNRSIELINKLPAITVKIATENLIMYWFDLCYTKGDYNLFYSEQWKIFIHAFQKFKEKQIAGSPALDPIQLIEMFDLWQNHLELILHADAMDICPDDVNVFQFERWLEKFTNDKIEVYNIPQISITYTDKDRLIIKRKLSYVQKE